MLNRQDFELVVEKLGFVTTIDLFTSPINTQLENSMSYRPDPKCIAVDPFTQLWTDLELYTFPILYAYPR